MAHVPSQMAQWFLIRSELPILEQARLSPAAVTSNSTIASFMDLPAPTSLPQRMEEAWNLKPASSIQEHSSHRAIGLTCDSKIATSLAASQLAALAISSSSKRAR